MQSCEKHCIIFEVIYTFKFTTSEKSGGGLPHTLAPVAVASARTGAGGNAAAALGATPRAAVGVVAAETIGGVDAVCK